MKKLLMLTLAAVLFVGAAEARHRGCCKPTNCAVECEPKCAPKRSNCIGTPRVVECTYSNNCVEGIKPDVCYLVPAERHIKKHTDVQTTVTYSCADAPCCSVVPTEEQLEQLRNEGAIRETCTAY